MKTVITEYAEWNDIDMDALSDKIDAHLKDQGLIVKHQPPTDDCPHSFTIITDKEEE